jgi:hypothetical protein
MIRGWLFRKLMGMSEFQYCIISLVFEDKKIRTGALMHAGMICAAFNFWFKNNFSLVNFRIRI